MDTFILRIQRQSGGICGLGMSTEVTIDGGNKRLFKAGDVQEYELPRKMTNIRLFNGVPVGKNIEDSFVLNPENHKILIITFSYKMNPKYFLPFGAFRHPQYLFDRKILFEDQTVQTSQFVNSVQAQTVAPQPQTSQAAQTAPASPEPTTNDAPSTSQEFKFCTECGTKNKRDAKFCIECGHHFEQ